MLKFRFYAKIMLFIHNQQSSKEFFYLYFIFFTAKAEFCKAEHTNSTDCYFPTTD